MTTFKSLLALSLTTLISLTSGATIAQTVSKYRVAVADLAVSDAVSPAGQKTLQESALINNIENAIRNGRKFELLTRRADALADIRKEQALAKSGLAAGDAAHEGQLSNAQSLIKVTVESFSFGRNATKVPNLDDKFKVSDHASVTMNVQIIDTSKGVVTGAFPIQASASSGSSLRNGRGSPSKAILDKALSKAAGELANQLADTIFPITVIQVKGNRLWVNRGNDSGMKLNERFTVYEPGEALIDPQTGENLGSAEMEVGEARVTRINPKVTVMELTKGDASQISQGFILRRPIK